MTLSAKSVRKQNIQPLLQQEGFLDQYAVLGHPISHSLSPVIHRLFAEQTKEKLQYSAILVQLDHLKKSLQDFQARNGKGVNITLPFKEEAFSMTDDHTESAKLAKAVNTIRFNQDGSLTGENTDGLGLIQDFKFNQKQTIQNKKILILGAGGAVRGILGPLLNEKPSMICIANRTEKKAHELVAQFQSLGNLTTAKLDALPHSFDIIFNAMSTFFSPPSHICHNETFCYDLNYGKERTHFLNWALQQNISACDGLGMLVEQAAFAFEFWRGIKPNTKEVFKHLRS